MVYNKLTSDDILRVFECGWVLRDKGFNIDESKKEFKELYKKYNNGCELK